MAAPDQPIAARLSYARFRFSLRVLTLMILPPYKGAVFRGVFGAALRRLVCVARDADCPACLLRPKCLYVALFDPMPPPAYTHAAKFRQAPRPYVLNPPLTIRRAFHPGDTLNFDLTLIGPALEALPYFIHVFQEQGRRGLGPERGRYELLQVEQIHSVGFQSQSAAPKLSGPHLASLREEKCGTAALGGVFQEQAGGPGPPSGKGFPGKDNKGCKVPAPLGRPSNPPLPPTAGGEGRGEGGAPATAPASLIYDAATRTLTAFTPEYGPLPDPADATTTQITLTFLTPLRLKEKGDLVTRLTFPLFFEHLTRRLSLLAAFYGSNSHGPAPSNPEASAPLPDLTPLLDLTKNINTTRYHLHWYDWQRYSRRQDALMNFGGLKGNFTLTGPLAPFLPYLRLGAALNLGQATTFGLGRYELAQEINTVTTDNKQRWD